jgi:hypothetical protein
MASIQKSQDIDTLSVRKIYAKGDSNTTLAANSVLMTDGSGGTIWVDISTFQRGVTFNTFETTQSTFTSGPNSSKFSILDGLNAGLLPSSSGNSATVYAKAFGQINVEGQDSIYSFDTYTGTINSNIQIVGSGVVEITTVSSLNKIEFYSPDNGTSSMSTVVGNFVTLNSSLENTIATFNSPFSTFIYDAISSYSTVQGPLVTFPRLNSTISSFSTSMGQVVRYSQLESTISSFSSIQGPLVTFPRLNSTISSFSTNIGQAVRFIELQSTISSFSSIQGDVVTFPRLNSTISSFSTSLGRVIRFNELQSSISSFSSILGPIVRVSQMNSTFSTFSTALGPVVNMEQIFSTMSSISSALIVDITNSISSFSTSMGPFVTNLNLLSSLSINNTVTQLNIGNLNVSTLNMLGSRQPYIQYGSNTLSSEGNITLNLPRAYTNSNYIIQLTYYNIDNTITNIQPLFSSNVSASSMSIYGTANSIFHWTTYGNLF